MRISAVLYVNAVLLTGQLYNCPVRIKFDMYIRRLISMRRLICNTRFFLLFFIIDVNDFNITGGMLYKQGGRWLTASLFWGIG